MKRKPDNHWNHIIVEAFCLYDYGKRKPIPPYCPGKISEDCLGPRGKKCRHLAHGSVEAWERKAMMGELFREWEKRNIKCG